MLFQPIPSSANISRKWSSITLSTSFDELFLKKSQLPAIEKTVAMLGSLRK
jgi:hypothetical protein